MSGGYLTLCKPARDEKYLPQSQHCKFGTAESCSRSKPRSLIVRPSHEGQNSSFDGMVGPSGMGLLRGRVTARVYSRDAEQRKRRLPPGVFWRRDEDRQRPSVESNGIGQFRMIVRRGPRRMSLATGKGIGNP